jgi:multimeric flavodoxin WrbA
MKTLLIVYHTLTGGARQMAEAAASAASAEREIAVRLLTATDAGPDDILIADGYIFATPENLAAMAGRMKDFFDRTYYPALDRINGRPYAPVAEPIIICTHAQTPEAILAPKTIPSQALDHCRDLGAAMAGGLAGGIF